MARSESISRRAFSNSYSIVQAMDGKADVEKVRHAVLSYMRKVLLGDRPDPNAYLVIRCFEKPFYDSGLAGLVAASWAVVSRVKMDFIDIPH